MQKTFCALLIVFSFLALPVMAEQVPTSVESLPFTNEAHSPNLDLVSIEPHAGNTANAEKKAGLPQFDVNTFSTQIFWLVIMFVGMYLFFARFALPRLSSTIESRQYTIKNDIDMAEKMSAEVTEVRQTYEEAIAKAHEQARTALTQADEKARAAMEEKSNEFKEQSQKSVSDLETRLNKQRTAIMAELEKVTCDATASILAKLTDQKFEDSDVAKAVSFHGQAHQSKPMQKAA